MFFHVFHPTLECFLNPSNSSFHVLWLAAIQWTAAGQNTMERWLSPHAQMTPNVSQDLVRWMQSQQSAINLKFKSKKHRTDQDRWSSESSGAGVLFQAHFCVFCWAPVSIQFLKQRARPVTGCIHSKVTSWPIEAHAPKKIHLVMMYLLCNFRSRCMYVFINIYIYRFIQLETRFDNVPCPNLQIRCRLIIIKLAFKKFTSCFGGHSAFHTFQVCLTALIDNGHCTNLRFQGPHG